MDLLPWHSSVAESAVPSFHEWAILQLYYSIYLAVLVRCTFYIKKWNPRLLCFVTLRKWVYTLIAGASMPLMFALYFVVLSLCMLNRNLSYVC